MAIFGKALALNYTTGKDILLREGNNWDVFLNYFFAVFFIFCFIIGILLNPFIIAYHAQQKRTFAKFLFLLVSSMDLFKSLYFPLVLVPKLLSPLGEEDYYYTMDSKLISWTAYSNTFLRSVNLFEIDVLVVLCVVRYKNLVSPLSSSRARNLAFSLFLAFDLLRIISIDCLLNFVREPIGYYRIMDSMLSFDQQHLNGVLLPVSHAFLAITCIFLLIGGTYTVLTIIYLRNFNTASSDTSRKNVRTSVISLVAMNVFNILVIITMITHGTVLLIHDKNIKMGLLFYSTADDFFQFANLYFTPLIQSTFNASSLLFICSSFKDFLMTFNCLKEI